jgi:hypothetical protein
MKVICLTKLKRKGMAQTFKVLPVWYLDIKKKLQPVGIIFACSAFWKVKKNL